jgi:hypothetical protein
LGDYQGGPRFAERGQLEEAQARLNQQQKWPDRTSGQRGAEKQVIVRSGNVRNPQLIVSGIATLKIEPLRL